MSFIPVTEKLNFQHYYSSVQSHNPSDIIVIMMIFPLKKHFLFSILNKVVLLNIFMETVIFFFQFLVIREFKRAAFIWNGNIENVTFHQLLLYKSLNFFKKHITDPKLWYYIALNINYVLNDGVIDMQWWFGLVRI